MNKIEIICTLNSSIIDIENTSTYNCIFQKCEYFVKQLIETLSISIKQHLIEIKRYNSNLIKLSISLYLPYSVNLNNAISIDDKLLYKHGNILIKKLAYSLNTTFTQQYVGFSYTAY